jgi:ABC-type sugar transport system substrate-binding protein
LRFKELFMQRWFRFTDSLKASTRSSGVWLRGVSARAALLMAAVAASASVGCDSGSILPPVNPELRGGGGATPVAVVDSTLSATVSEVAPEPARPIEVFLGVHDPDETEIWKSSARMQAGLDKARLKVSVLEADSPKSKQAEQIREAISHHPRGLVVEPADPADPRLAEAILTAQRQGIPVVMLGQPPAGVKPGPASPEAATKSSASQEHQAPLVVLEPKFAESAQQMVAAAIQGARTCELDPKGGAVVVATESSDPFLSLRLLAIHDALKAAGVPVLDEVRISNDPKDGEEVVKEHLKKHPKSVMVFAVDPKSTVTVRSVIGSDAVGRVVIGASYTDEDRFSSIARSPNFAAVADFTATRLLRKGISSAVAVAQGKSLQPVIEFRIKVVEPPVNPTTLRAQVLIPQKAPVTAPRRRE